MFRMLRYGLLGLVFALPFAMPQASQAAAPGIVVRCRPVIVRPCYAGRVAYSPFRSHYVGWFHR